MDIKKMKLALIYTVLLVINAFICLFGIIFCKTYGYIKFLDYVFNIESFTCFFYMVAGVVIFWIKLIKTIIDGVKDRPIVNDLISTIVFFVEPYLFILEISVMMAFTIGMSV